MHDLLLKLDNIHLAVRQPLRKEGGHRTAAQPDAQNPQGLRRLGRNLWQHRRTESREPCQDDGHDSLRVIQRQSFGAQPNGRRVVQGPETHLGHGLHQVRGALCRREAQHAPFLSRALRGSRWCLVLVRGVRGNLQRATKLQRQVQQRATWRQVLVLQSSPPRVQRSVGIEQRCQVPALLALNASRKGPLASRSAADFSGRVCEDASPGDPDLCRTSQTPRAARPHGESPFGHRSRPGTEKPAAH
mmetsp:Transcript_11570/g.29934  ORF Transcript_11570/g.29934 Transcript_11570/m.29934 type:complete len:245 (+) Transcript_11570:567-1301(+)